MRGLEREISKLCRKAVKQLLLDKSLKHIEINGDNLHDYLGVQPVSYTHRDVYKRQVPAGSESHFKVVLVSDRFTGERFLNRHRMIYSTLAEELSTTCLLYTSRCV